MLFNPITQQLFTDEYEPIKTLGCPYTMRWNQLSSSGSGARRCSLCEKEITDTGGLPDEQVLAMVRKDPAVCLKIDIAQDNVRVVTCNV